MPTDAGPTLPPEVQQALRKPEQTFGRYILLKELGRGGMGAVHKAWQLDLRRYVAIKFLLGAQGEEELKRFYREAQTAAQVTHPNIAAIYEVGVQDGKHFIAMEFIDGRTMDKLPMPQDRASVLRVAKALRDAARAVDFAHAKGIIHRDLKPANIMLTRTGKVYVTDFGLAKQVKGDVKITGTGLIVGTPPFMSPEQAQGDTKRLDRYTDIWSLGATLYAAVAGRPPFEARGALATLHKVVNDDPPPPTRFSPVVPREIEAISLKALEKSKSRRYRAAGEFADDLDRFLNGVPVQAKPPTPSALFWRWMKRRKAAAGIAAASLIAVALLIVLLTRPTPPPVPQVRKTMSTEDEQKLSVLQQFSTDLPARLTQERKTIRDAQDEIRRALGALDEILERNVDSARAHYLKARLLQMFGAHRKALRSYDDCIGLEPKSVLALYHRARLLIHTALTQASELRWRGTIEKTLERATADAERAQRDSQGLLTATDALLIRAYRLYREGTLEEALALCRQNPTNEDLLFLAAMCLERYGRHEEAQADLDEAVRLRPWFYEALCEKATTFYYQVRDDVGDEKKTLDACEEAIRANPNYAPSYYVRASVHSKLRRFDKMLEDADRARELDPDSPDVRLCRAVALAGLGRLEEGEKECESILRAMPKEASAYFNQGMMYKVAKKPEQAIAAFSRSISANPQFAAAYIQRASLHLDQGDAIRAMEDGDAAAKIDRTSHRALWVAARGYIELKKCDKAVERLTEAIRLNDRCATYYGDRAACFEALGRYPEAIADFKKAAELDPKLEPQTGPRIRKIVELILPW